VTGRREEKREQAGEKTDVNSKKREEREGKRRRDERRGEGREEEQRREKENRRASGVKTW
jgi:hypothetical protein